MEISLAGKVFLSLLSSYIIGSFPSGYIFFKAKTGRDIRNHGARRNIGATNAFIEGGFRVGALTALFDLAKGLIPILISRRIFGSSTMLSEGMMVACGILAVLGHIFPLFLNFRGGTGLSTSAGAICGIIPDIALPCIAIVLILTFITKRPALTGMIVLALIPFYSYFQGRSAVIVGMTSVMAVVYFSVSMTHLSSMLRGDEYKEFSSKFKKAAGGEKCEKGRNTL